MEYYRQPPSDTLHALDSTPDGLTPAQAAARLARDGRNVLTEPPKPSLVKRFFQQLADPMILVLLAAALISAITSAYAHESFADVIIILIVVIINAVLGVYQESKAEQAIAALKELSAAHSRVLRGGKLVTVPSEKLVVGDVLVLEAGDAVPADARVLESASLRAEEAALTGESVPVTKSPDALTAAGDIGPGDRSNMLYLGSSIVYGRGRAVVTETGMQTQMGHIADALTQTKENKTPLQLRLTQLSRILTWLVLGICAVVFAVGVLRAGTINGRVVLDTFLIAVSLAVAAIPEGLAAVVRPVLVEIHACDDHARDEDGGVARRDLPPLGPCFRAAQFDAPLQRSEGLVGVDRCGGTEPVSGEEHEVERFEPAAVLLRGVVPVFDLAVGGFVEFSFEKFGQQVVVDLFHKFGF